MVSRFAFAHLSDPHLPMGDALPRPLRLLAGKRLSGYLSWRHHRSGVHRPEILAQTVADAQAVSANHILITGDLINIALPSEYLDARTWLSGLGSPDDVTVVPGNHDMTVPIPWAEGPGLWQPWMRGDDGEGGGGAGEFPFVRIRGPVAFIGVSTALPTPVFRASGLMGTEQLARLERILQKLDGRGLVRVVALHHSPLAGATSRRKGLLDQHALATVLSRSGAELVVHGHLHKPSFGALPGPAGNIPVIGAPSASTMSSGKSVAARWHLYTLEDEGDASFLKLTIRQHADRTGRFETAGQISIPLPTAQ